MTKYVTEAGGNVREAPGIRLGNHFSLTMLVEVPENKVTNLMNTLKTTDLHASVYQADPCEYLPTEAAQVGYTGKFVLEGADHPGIIHSVTSL
jgi:glycine cleavage system regulatory protein